MCRCIYIYIYIYICVGLAVLQAVLPLALVARAVREHLTAEVFYRCMCAYIYIYIYIYM